MAQHNLRYAAETVRALEKKDPERLAALMEATGMQMSEADDWEKAATEMYIPFDEELAIHPQDDDFLAKAVWDFDSTPADKYPLLQFYHPLVIYRHQVIKQTDVVLALFLLGRDFSLDQKKRNYDYYDPLTTGDSSLSSSIQSIVAFEVGYTEKAIAYLAQAVLMDLADVGGNVKDGAHIASMGGAWMTIVYGIAGMRDYDGELSFDPNLTEIGGAGLRFPLTIGQQRLIVDIDNEGATYLLEEATPSRSNTADNQSISRLVIR